MGARGPLPDPNARRRNAPTIPTTNLPASGFAGPTPSIPSWVKLGKSGKAWWRWAWSTPQAAAWGAGVGQEPLVARRASLEDDLTYLDTVVNGVSLDDLENDEQYRELAAAMRRVAAMASGRLQVMREMRELDDRLGLTPKGMAALRWTVVADKVEDAKPASAPGVASIADRRARLTGS